MIEEWNFKSTEKRSTGYEEELDSLIKKYNNENYILLNKIEKEKMEKEVFDIYRDKNIFPITYYNKKRSTGRNQEMHR